MASFEKAITNTHVDSTEGRLFLNGVLKDAINYPTQNKIVFNRLAWRDLSGERNRFLFVLHEYLGIMGLDDSRYTVSGAALKEIAKDSLVCVSVAQDAYTHFEVTGKAVLNLIGKDSAQWRDQFLNYSISVNASNNPVFFVLSTVDLKSQATQRMIVNLHRAKPEVDLNFSIQTEQKINGYPVTDIEIECH